MRYKNYYKDYPNIGWYFGFLLLFLGGLHIPVIIAELGNRIPLIVFGHLIVSGFVLIYWIIEAKHRPYYK